MVKEGLTKTFDEENERLASGLTTYANGENIGVKRRRTLKHGECTHGKFCTGPTRWEPMHEEAEN